MGAEPKLSAYVPLTHLEATFAFTATLVNHVRMVDEMQNDLLVARLL
jgi:hypothetical protein